MLFLALFALFVLSAFTALPVLRQGKPFPEIWWVRYFFFTKKQSIYPTDVPAGTHFGASVLIAARNEAENLERYLPLVLNQTYPFDFEVVVINDASSDATLYVLQQMEKQYPNLRIVHLPEKQSVGKKAAIEAGIRAAQYDILAFTDADCWPSTPHWLEKMCQPFTQNAATEIVLGYAPEIPAPAENNFLWTVAELGGSFYTAFSYAGMTQAGMPYMGVGRNMAWRKPLFDRAGGFTAHQHLASGDDDLFINASATPYNVVLCFDYEAFVYSKMKSNIGDWWRQKRRHVRAGALYKTQHRLVLGALALAHSGHYAALLVLSFTDWALWAWAVWAIRMAFVSTSWRRMMRITDEWRPCFYIPITDAAIGLYFGVIGLWQIFGKKREEW
jgi:poly-beta-1,6-N-acetyl-D-glucosamine synthase